jgi:hypothetical protein
MFEVLVLRDSDLRLWLCFASDLRKIGSDFKKA